MQTLSRRGRVSDGGQMTFPFLKVTKFPNDVLFFHRISLQQDRDKRVIRFAEMGAGEGFVGFPERRVAVVQYTITPHVDGDVLEAFWSYCSEFGFVKVPRNNKHRIWVRGFLFTYIPIHFLECLVCVGLRGNVNSCDYDHCKFPR